MDEKIEKRNIFTEKKTLIIGAVVIAVLLIITVIILLLPGNRANRALNKADKLFIEEKYQEASEKYTKAFSIKENLTKAYSGLILTDLALVNGNAGEDMAFANEKVLEYGGFEDEEGVNDLIDLYLLAPESLSGKPEELIKVLLDGYNYTNQAEELLPAIGDAYILMADSLKDEDVESALDYYDKAYELRNTDANLIGKMKEVVTKYVADLINSDKYEDAFLLVSKYGASLSLDVEGLNNDISVAKDMYETKVTLLSQAYDSMKFYYDLVGKDFSKEMLSDSSSTLLGMMSCGWQEMLQLDGSYAADLIANSGAQKFYAYSPDGFDTNYNGFAVALYTYGDEYVDVDGKTSIPYYFFFGEYKNGIRNGYGFSIIKNATSSYLGFEGNWQDDVPNGFGAYYQSDMYAYTSLAKYQRLTYGDWTNGLQNGLMTTRVRLSENPEETFESTYTASLGNVESVPKETADYEILDEEKEGYDLITVAPSVSSGYDFYIPIYKKTDKLLSAIGF